MSRTCNIEILPEEKNITCNYRENLFQVLLDADIGLQSLCGGEGTCKRCQVIIKKGELARLNPVHLSSEKVKQGYVLACQVEIKSDLQVEIPESSRLAGEVMNRNKQEDEEQVAGGLCQLDHVTIDPFFQQLTLKLHPPSLQNNTSDLDRLYRALQKETGKNNFEIDQELLPKLAEKLRTNNWEVKVSYIDLFNRVQIIDIEHIESAIVKKNYGLAVDIGTTSVVVQLVDLNQGTCLTVRGDYNKQGQFGADVISRINYINNHDQGLQKLQSAIIVTINELIVDIKQKEKISSDSIREVVCAGNTTMIHIFYGLDPNNIRKDPYTPTVATPPPLKAETLDLDIHPRARVFSYAASGSFVGGDISAGVMSTDLTSSTQMTLFIDIGTNGEIVLGNQEFLVGCSASAGPAFEGGGIKHGIRAMAGAIEKVKISPEDYDVQYETIASKKPIGICGTGLINILAALEETGLISRTGEFNSDISNSRLYETEEGYEFVLVPAKKTAIAEDIVISSNDIKNLMRSKAAIFAGIQMLLKNMAFDTEMIEKVLIAGGFGNYLDLEAAIQIGLLPDLPRTCFEFVGNTSLMGAIKGLIDRSLFEEGQKLAQKMTYLELSAEDQASAFMDEFVAAKFIPHTDLDLFSSLANDNKTDKIILNLE